MTNNKFDKPSIIEAVHFSPVLSRRRISDGELEVLLPKRLEEINAGWNLRLKTDPLLNSPESYENEAMVRSSLTEREYGRFFEQISEVERIEGLFRNPNDTIPRHNDRTRFELSLAVCLLTESKRKFIQNLRSPKVTWSQIRSANSELSQFVGDKEESQTRRAKMVEKKLDKVQDELEQYCKAWNFPANLTIAYLRSLIVSVATNDLPNIDNEMLQNVDDAKSLDKKTKETLFADYNFDRESTNLLSPNTERSRHICAHQVVDSEFVDSLKEKGDRKRILTSYLDRSDPQYSERLIRLCRKMALTYDQKRNRLKPDRATFEKIPQDLLEILAERIEFDTIAIRIVERIIVEKTAPPYFEKHPGNKPEGLKRAVTAQVLKLYDNQHDPQKRNLALRELYSLGSPFIIDDLLRRTRHTSHDGVYITRPFDPIGKGLDWGTAAQRAIGEMNTIARREVGFDLNKLLNDKEAINFTTANAMEASITPAKNHYRKVLDQIYDGHPNLALGLKRIILNSLNA